MNLQPISMIVILIIENVFLYLFFRKLGIRLNEKRRKEEEKFHKEIVQPALKEIIKNLKK